MKLILAKSKIINLEKIQNVYNYIFRELKIFPKKLKLRKNKNDYGYKHFILSLTNNKISKLITYILPKKSNGSSQNITNIIIIKNFLLNNEKKIKKLNFKFAKGLKDLFRLKNKNYIYIYLYFLLINSEKSPKDSSKEFLNVICFFNL
jgi:hypothetical protein